jgi:hypothetical protein
MKLKSYTTKEMISKDFSKEKATHRMGENLCKLYI